jgi:hypothetical protein
MKLILNSETRARMLERVRSLAANPLLVLSIGAVAALVVSYISVRYLRYDAWTLFYNIPVGVAFLVFCFDRLHVLGRQRFIAYALDALDALLLMAAITRMFVLVPFYSGHTLFLVYFLLTAQLRLARLVAFAVLVQVVIVKIMLTDGTLIGGAMLAAAAAFVYRVLTKVGFREKSWHGRHEWRTL